MKKRIYLLLALMVVSIGTVFAQISKGTDRSFVHPDRPYYNNPDASRLFKFDVDAQNWTIGAGAVVASTNTNSNYYGKNVERNLSGSANNGKEIEFAVDASAISTPIAIESPNIDAGAATNNGATDMCIGFTLNTTLDRTVNASWACVISNDGATWDTIWASDSAVVRNYTPYTSTAFEHAQRFTTYNIFVPKTSNYATTSTLKVRIVLLKTTGTSTMNGAKNLVLAGAFVSARRAVDLQVTRAGYGSYFLNADSASPIAMPVSTGFANGATNSNYQTYKYDAPMGISGVATTVSMQIKNLGQTLISSGTVIPVGYKVVTTGEADAYVSESLTLSADLPLGGVVNYTFSQKLTVPGGKSKALYTFVGQRAGDNMQANDTSIGLITITNKTLIPPLTSSFQGLNLPSGYYDMGAAYFTVANIPDAGAVQHRFWSGNKNEEVVRGFLWSDPIAVTNGEYYEIVVDAGPFSYYPSSINKASISFYANPNGDTTGINGITPLYTTGELTPQTRLKSRSMRFQAQADNYSVVVEGVSGYKPKNTMYFKTISVRAVLDTNATVEFITPAVGDYSTAQKIKVNVINAGKKAIVANAIKLYCQVDANPVIERTFPNALAAFEEQEYEFDSAFDLHAVGTTANVKVWVDLEHDQNRLNDTIAQTLKHSAVYTPYISNPQMDMQYNVVEDKNSDNIKWGLSSDFKAYQYGPAATSNDIMYLRPLSLAANKLIEVKFTAKTDTFTAPLAVKFYKRAVDGSFTEAGDIWSGEVAQSSHDYTERFTVPADLTDYGYIGFSVVGSNPIQTLRLSGVSIEQLFDTNMAVTKIILPIDTNLIDDVVDRYPVAMIIENMGLDSIQDVKVGFHIYDFKIDMSAARTIKEKYVKNITLPKKLGKNDKYTIYLDTCYELRLSVASYVRAFVNVEGEEAFYNDTLELFLNKMQSSPGTGTASVLPLNYVNISNFKFLAVYNRNGDNKTYTRSATIPRMSLSLNRGEVANDFVLTQEVSQAKLQTYQVTFEASHSGDSSARFRVLAGVAPTTTVMPYVYGVDTNRNFKELYVYTNGVKDESVIFGGSSKGGNHIVYYQSDETTNKFRIAFHADSGVRNSTIYRLNVKRVDTAVAKTDVSVGIAYPNNGVNRVFSSKDSLVFTFTNHNSLPVDGIEYDYWINGQHYSGTAFNDDGTNNGLAKGESFKLKIDSINYFDEMKAYEVKVAIRKYSLDTNQTNDTAVSNFVSVPYHKVTMSELRPGSGKPNAAVAVSVKVKNTGKGSWKVPVNYQLDSATVVSDTTIELAVGEETVHTFATTVDLSAEKVYKIAAYSSFDKDVNPALNDTVSRFITIANSDFDVNPVQLITPITKRLGNKEEVKISVKNNTALVLYDIPVRCVISGQKDIEINGTLSSIAANETVEYAFPDSVNMSTPGIYNFAVITEFEPDEVRTNDTLRTSVQCARLDIRVSNILKPITSGKFTESEVVSVRVVNSSEIPVTKFDVYFRLDSKNPQRVSYVDSVAVNDSALIDFESTIDLSAAKEYTLKSWTRLIGDDDNTNDTVTIVIVSSGKVSNKEADQEIVFNVYPNPAVSYLNVVSEDPINHVVVYDMNGRVKEQVNGIRQTNYMVRVDGYEAGTYVVEIHTAKGKSSRTFIVR